MNKEETLNDLFYNKLSLDNSIKNLITKIMSPYTNYADYMKYGDMFISLKSIDREIK